MLAEATASIVWTAEADGRFGASQPGWSDFTGQDLAAFSGHGWLDAIHPTDVHRMLPALREANGTVVLDHRLRRRDGVWRDMAMRAVPIMSDHGTVEEWLGCHTDVTDRRALAEDLAAALEAAGSANRARSQFLANMGHQMRTPLSAVIGYSEMLTEELQETGHGHLLRDLNKISDNARHLLGVINDVLDLAAMENDRPTLLAEDFDLTALVTEVAAATLDMVARRRNVLTVQTAPHLGRLNTDRSKLRHCLLNLIGNAAGLTDGGTIGLTAWREQRDGADWAMFAVRDSGIGMTEDQLAGLFLQFAQTDPYVNRGGDAGLGLAVCRGLAVWLGGDLEVASAYGVGTTLTLSVPGR